MTVRLYSTTPASNNSAPPNGWPEGQAASTVNDCARQMMAEIRETFEESPYFDFGDTPTRIDNDTFTVATDLTARYAVGCGVKLVGATTGTGRISVSSFGAGVTTIDVVMDSGNVPTSLVRVAVTPVASAAKFGTVTTVSGNYSGIQSYTLAGSSTDYALSIRSSRPGIALRETDGASSNQDWILEAQGEQLAGKATDSSGTGNNWITVDRTGTTIDTVRFPAEASGVSNSLVVGTANAVNYDGGQLMFVRRTGNGSALALNNQLVSNATLVVTNEANAGDRQLIRFNVIGPGLPTNVGSIDYSSAGGVTRYNTTCDERIKKNFAPAGSAIALAMSIPVEQFDLRDTGQHVDFGYVAQRLLRVVPYAVSVPPDPAMLLGVDRGSIVPILHRSIQELIERVRALEAQRS